MLFLAGDLGATRSQTRREYRWLEGADFGDGRCGTLWLEVWHAKRRDGVRTWLSRYSVSEVNKVGFAGRAFKFDKEVGEGEYDEGRPGVPPPPYTVGVGDDGEVWCTCMAGACKADCCRHVDAVLALLDRGAFRTQLAGC